MLTIFLAHKVWHVMKLEQGGYYNRFIPFIARARSKRRDVIGRFIRTCCSLLWTCSSTSSSSKFKVQSLYTWPRGHSKAWKANIQNCRSNTADYCGITVQSWLPEVLIEVQNAYIAQYPEHEVRMRVGAAQTSGYKARGNRKNSSGGVSVLLQRGCAVHSDYFIQAWRSLVNVSSLSCNVTYMYKYVISTYACQRRVQLT